MDELGSCFEKKKGIMGHPGKAKSEIINEARCFQDIYICKYDFFLIAPALSLAVVKFKQMICFVRNREFVPVTIISIDTSS